MQFTYVFIVYVRTKIYVSGDTISLVFIIRLKAGDSSCMAPIWLFDILRTVALITLHIFQLHIINISEVSLRSFPLGKPSGLSYGYCY